MESLFNDGAAAIGDDTEFESATSSPIQGCFSTAGGSNKKSTETSSHEGTVETVDGVPKVELGSLPLVDSLPLFVKPGKSCSSTGGIGDDDSSPSTSKSFPSDSLDAISTFSFSILTVESCAFHGLKVFVTVYPMSELNSFEFDVFVCANCNVMTSA